MKEESLDQDITPVTEATTESPYSSSDRKRKLDDIENCLKSGKFTEKKMNDCFMEILDENRAKINKLRCIKCQKIFSTNSGGNKTAHRRGNCVKNSVPIRNLNTTESLSMKNSLVLYIMKSGVSFHHIQSETFRTMAKSLMSIGANDIDIDSLRIPSEEWLRNEVEKKGNEIFQKIAAEIAAPVQREECCLVLDFGKKVHDFLSVFIVFIDRTSEKPTLKSVPFMFSPVFSEKKTEKIVDCIVEGGERFNLNRDQILKMRVVGDGASNIKKLSQYFRSYTLCSCHSLQKSAERVLDPLDESCHEFDSEELSHLREIFDAVDDCGDLASRLRRYKNHHDLEKLPVAYCKTRWMTFVYCTLDIIEMFPKIDRIENAFIEKYCDKIRPKLANLITSMQILKVYEKPLKVLEETHMRIHEVAPWLFKLRAYFEEQEKKGIQDRDYTKSTVSKSACISLNHYISKTISDPHLLASLLCPGMRSLSLFPQTYKDKALKLLKEELELIKLEPKDQEIAEFDNLTKDLYDAPPPAPSASSELQDYQTAIFSNSDIVAPPIEFWHKHENRFPRLAKVAGSVFCTLSSESICERAFSALNRVFRNDRQSLEPEMVEILMVSYLYLNSST